MNDRSVIMPNMGMNGMGGLLVVGAGPTGLALAIEMARAGLPVRIIDRNSGPAKWSQALVVQARTLEQFERYGIAEKTVAQGHPIRHAELFHRSHRIVHMDLARVASRYPFVLFLPQNETEALLLEHLQSLGVEVERNTELVSFTDGANGGSATIRSSGCDTETVPYRWLAGCDGAHSTVRHALEVPFEGDAVGLRFFLGDLKVTGADVPSDNLVIHLQHGDVLFIARLRNDITRVIAVQHSAQDSSADRMPEIADFQQWIDAFHLDIQVHDAIWRAPFHINERKARYYRKGNAFLAGDASHIHSPVAGQGMNTGLQDAANLAWKLIAVAGGAPEALLDSYNEERGAVGDALLSSTSRGLEMATTTNPFMVLLRDLAGTAISNLPFAQKQIAAFISETAIEYRDSSIVTDLGGSGNLRAGDRVPNPRVTLADGTQQLLLAPLATPQHLLITQGLTHHAAAASLLRGVTALELGPQQSSEFVDHFGSEPGIWVVRPDGYLAFRAGPEALPALADYARGMGILAG
jgi:2-polyprenyl-6-methoxyphenol hydroxylase-like FAD-dependent oxidoreductase